MPCVMQDGKVRPGRGGQMLDDEDKTGKAVFVTIMAMGVVEAVLEDLLVES